MTVIIKRRITHLAYSFILLAQILLAFAVIATPAQAQTPVGHWRFDDGSGTKAADSSENGHTATLANGISWVKGPIGDAVSANELKKQYVIIPAIDLSGTQAVTVTLWANRTYSTAGAHVLFEATSNYTTSTTGLGFFPDDITCNGIQAAVRGNVGYSANCYSQPSSGVWHHLAVVFDKKQTAGDEVKFYVDGLLQTVNRSLYASTNTNNFGNNRFYLFSRAGTTDFNSGMIDDLRIYDSALTAQQIQQIYNSAGLGSVAGTSGSTSIATGTQQQFTAAAADSITVTRSDRDIKQNASGGSGNNPVVNFALYGVADATTDSTCAMTSHSHNLTCSDAPFKVCPKGKTISVNSALAAGSNPYPLQLTSSVTSCSSSTVAVLFDQATNNTGFNTTAIWGTDNMPAAQTAVTASSRGTLIFPPGKWLFHAASGISMNVNSYSTYWVQQGATVYMVGVSGAYGADGAERLFQIPDGTSNVTFQIDGIIAGENTRSVYIGQNTMNQSQVIHSLGATDAAISDITVQGTGEFLNLYGFSAHNEGNSQRYNVLGMRHINVAKGLNVNGDYSTQSGNSFLNSGALESAGSVGFSIFNNNTFNNSGLQYVMFIGGQTSPGYTCNGDVVHGNTISNIPSFLTGGGIVLDDCTQNAVVSDNTIGNLSGSQIGFVVTSAGYNPVRNNLLSNNVVTCNGGLAGFFMGATSGNKLIGNQVKYAGTKCNYGALFDSSNDESYSNMYIGSNFDELFNLQTNTLSVDDHLLGTRTWAVSTGTINPASVFINSLASSSGCIY